jgi:FMN phosphatase YigB (HAD superfamily)
MQIGAVLFDLHGTFAFLRKGVTDDDVSRFLISHGYEVYPQSWKAAWQYVSFIDYPKNGYLTWESYLQQVFKRISLKPDGRTLRELAKLYKGAKWSLYPDAREAVIIAKKAGLKTGIVTTIANFKYRSALKPVLNKIDLIVDGYTFNCEKSNPRIYLKTLDALKVEARHVAMIGDEVQLDVLLPKSLGMRAILLDRTGKLQRTNFKEADAVVRSLKEAMNIVLTRLS